MSETVWLIQDCKQGGWAEANPIEGWCFTRLRRSAKEFKSKREAADVANRHYDIDSVRIVKEVVS